MVFDFIKGALGGAGAGSAFGPWGAGIGAVLGGVSSLGGSSSSGGGSGGYGGGGGGTMFQLASTQSICNGLYER